MEGKIHFETVIFDIRKVAKKIHKQNLTITKKLMKSFYGRMKIKKMIKTFRFGFFLELETPQDYRVSIATI